MHHIPTSQSKMKLQTENQQVASGIEPVVQKQESTPNVQLYPMHPRQSSAICRKNRRIWTSLGQHKRTSRMVSALASYPLTIGLKDGDLIQLEQRANAKKHI